MTEGGLKMSNSIANGEFSDFNDDFSIALEYTGSLLNLSRIPLAFPVDVDDIPTANVAILPSFSSNSSFPVAEPVVKILPPAKLVSSVRVMDETRVRVLNDGDHDLGLVDGFEGNGYLNGVESSGPLGFSDSQDHSNELSRSSDMVETPIDVDLSLAAQTFDHDSGEISCDQEDFVDGNEESITPERRVAEKPAKRGLCYHCHRGNRFTEKEACLVCDAKYCKRCILKTMGSMPEGRKCISCIGAPVDESKRYLLGKSSRMLKGLFLDSEVKQIMESEVSCPANQLPPEQIFVNGRALCIEELMLLKSCPNPPRSLKPGSYWYDRVAGFWGQEGQKPCQIITPRLNVGDQNMNPEASNGNTDVHINGRRITKQELWMLQSAGVECAGNPTFWVDSEGSYQEEGMNVIKGKIWGRKRTKVLCTLLSLPTPDSPVPKRQVNGPVDSVISGYLEQIGLCKVLLVGDDQSGTSTFYKQARILHKVPFSLEERQNIKYTIQNNMYVYLGRVLEWCQQFEEESLLDLRQSRDPSVMAHEIQEKTQYTIKPELKAFSDELIEAMVSGNLDITRDYASYVDELWKDAAIQATYRRKDELDLPGAASYFLDKAIEIAKADYEPSDMDIIYAEGVTSSNGVATMEFSFPPVENKGFRDLSEHPDPITRCQLIRVNAKNLGENCKWLDMFEDAGIVLFCISLTDYSEYKVDSNGDLVNKMLESKRLFESIITHPTFKGTNFLLLLTKFDLLGENVEKIPLNHCEWFEDFSPLLSRNSISSGNKVSPLAQRAFHYMGLKFKRLFSSLTGRNLYVCPVFGMEPESIDNALSYAREVIIWEEENLRLSSNDSSSSESVENEPSSSYI